MKKLVYLCSVYSYPYDDTVTPQVKEKRFRLAAKAVGCITDKGEYNVFSSVVYIHPVSKYYKTRIDSILWMDQCDQMLELADEVWILENEDWQKAKGVQREISLAKVFGKKIKMVTPRGRVFKFIEGI